MCGLRGRLFVLVIVLLLAGCRSQPPPTAPGGEVVASPPSTATAPASPALPAARATATSGHTAAPPATRPVTAEPTVTAAPPAQDVGAPLPLSVEMSFTLMAHEGGEVHSVALAGQRVYVGAGVRVLALDVTNPAAPQVVARSEPLPGPVEALLAVQVGAAVRVYAGAGQNLAALAQGADGELAVQGTLPLPGWVSSLAWSDDGLFVGGALPGAIYPEGGFVALVDMQQPGALSLRQTVETANYVSALAFARGALYSAHLGYTGARLMVTAVEGGQLAAPHIVRGVENELYTLHVAGDTLLVGGYGTLQAFDIAGAEGPQRLWQVEQGERFPLGMVNGVAVAGGQIYVSGWQPAGAYIPFRHSLRPPQPLAGGPGAAASNDVLAHGSRLYVAEAGELEIYEISQAATLNAVGRFKPFPAPISDLALQSTGPGEELLMLYVASPDDRAPEELLNLRLPSLEVAGRLSLEVEDVESMIGQASVSELEMGAGWAYAVARDGIYTLDVADAAAPQVASRYPFSEPRRDPRGVVWLGEQLYLGTGWGDFVEITALAPDSAGVLTQTQSVRMGRFEGSQLMAMAGAGQRLYVTTAAGTEQGWLHVVQAGEELEAVATLPLPGYAQAALAVDGDLVATAAHNEEMGDTLLLIDLSAPAAPAIVARISLDGLVQGQPYVHTLAFHDGLLFAVVSGQRLLVVDVTDPARPRGVGLAELPSRHYNERVALAVGDGLVAAANGAAGVMLYAFEGPAPAGDRPVVWLDGERFLYESERPGRSTLLLGAIDGAVREIGLVSGDLGSYGFIK